MNLIPHQAHTMKQNFQSRLKKQITVVKHFHEVTVLLLYILKLQYLS